MKGILRKKEDHYFFWSSDWDPDKGEGFVANTARLVSPKLSFKNCQVVETGYDLDELAKYFAYNQSNEDSQEEFAKFAFIEGFQKAIEIIGDKKFSEDEVISIIEKSRETGLTAEYLILTNQPTQFEVEVEMENYEISDKYSNSIHCERPKLDADECLILKRS